VNRRIEVSVVLPFRNARATIISSIRSILMQTFEAFELVAVDDASTDGSLGLVRSLADPRIKILVNDRNLGLAGSLNRGIDAASARYIARMDADDLSYPARLEMQYECLEEHRNVDVLGTSALMFSGGGECVGVLPSTADHAGICRSGRLGSFPLYHPTWMGKAAWFRGHHYDESFRKAQDFELLLRAASVSTYANLEEVLVGYRYSPHSSLRKRLETRRYTWLAMRKNFAATHDLPALIGGGVMTGAKALRDLLISLRIPGVGSSTTRIADATPGQVKRWREVWREFQGQEVTWTMAT